MASPVSTLPEPAVPRRFDNRNTDIPTIPDDVKEDLEIVETKMFPIQWLEDHNVIVPVILIGLIILFILIIIFVVPTLRPTESFYKNTSRPRFYR